MQVTVPVLGGSEPMVSPSSGDAVEGSGAPPTGSVPVASTPGAADPALPTTVNVQLVDCADCAVIGTHANVVGSYSAALTTRGGRATLLAVDPAGTVAGVLNVPYGVSFPPPAEGRLACGAGGRCVVVAGQPDGTAVLSVFELTAAGTWRDLSGAGGFVSATSKGAPVAIEDSLGVAIQVSDGATTVWTVLSWNGQQFSVLGCAPDGDAPDLAALDLTSCLS